MRSLLLSLTLILPLAAEVTGWTNWRGPLQTGASLETDLPSKTEPGKELWTYDLKGAGTPVIADGLLYAFGFTGGTGEEVQELLVCLDAVTGEKKWEKRFPDYISDIVYSRYGIGSPVIDPETGNVYLQLSNGRCVAFTRDGEPLWEHSLMEEYGRLTFPNGRTGSPAVFEHLVIFHCVTANWGTNGPAQDRFYAFDKQSGELVWYSSPGVRPIDSSFSMPVFGKLGGHDVFYAGTGCGNVVCVDANTGDPLWRFQFASGGINSQVVLVGDDRLVAVHGKENLDVTDKGRMVCLKIPTEYPDEQLVLGKDAEVWRNDDPVAFTSSPVLAENKVFITVATGELLCIDVESGETLWSEKLAPDQIHASPTFGDSKLYVPMFDGAFYVLDPGRDSDKHLYEHKFEESCLGAPAIWAGKVYLITKEKLHCWGPAEGEFRGIDIPVDQQTASSDKITQLQIVPAEFALKPGDSQTFTVYGLNAVGQRVSVVKPNKWATFIPPTAKVKAKVDASFDGSTLKAAEDAKLSAGAFKATWNGLSATTRGRVVAGYDYAEDFEDFELTMKNPLDEAEAVTFPPLPWLGARIKWHVLERDGSKVIANRLDNILFQRTMNFFGSGDMRDYTLQGDMMTDGNRRVMSTVGFVNQRYLITLVGNSQILEISSNYDRVRSSTKFRVRPNTWYHLKTKVDRKDDGTGTVHAKAWPRGEDEPSDWTLSVPVDDCHPQGAPAVYAFSPQVQKRVYIDNIKITKK